MKPIRILIIDDQYARDDFPRDDLLTKTKIAESGSSQPAANGIEAVFCSGQSVDGNVVKNDYGVIAKAVRQDYGRGADFGWGLVLLDVRFDSQPLLSDDDTFGLRVREELRRDFPDLPIVMFSGKHESKIIESNDSQEPYLSKDGINERELKLQLLKHGLLSLEQVRHLSGLTQDIIFVSDEMRNIYIEAYEYAKSSKPVLILGESGSGKEVLAEHIHRMSPRNDKPFVAINTAAIPKDLIESELFGHVRGAFTGATTTRPGCFEQAEGGTLFLDEIGDMPADSQTRLLRVLQDGIYYRVGGHQPINSNVRIISATHQNLEERVKQELFREDLYYRINQAPIVIPPLRKHREDILPLAQAMLKKAMGDDKKGIIFSEKARSKLEMYDFPGNVRELRSIIERLVAKTGNNREISAEDIKFTIPSGGTAKTVTEGGASSDMQLPTTSFQGNLKIAEPSIMQPTTQPNVTLANLHEIIAALTVEQNDPALDGIKPRLENVVQALLQRCVGAALERFNKPGVKYELRPAMRLLTGDITLEGPRAIRELDKILNRQQKTSTVQQNELVALVESWKSSENKE